MEGMSHFQPAPKGSPDGKIDSILSRITQKPGTRLTDTERRILEDAGLGDQVEKIDNHTWDTQFPWIDKQPPEQPPMH